MADALCGSMDSAEYKHVALGLIFLKYISGAIEVRCAADLAEWGKDAAEDRDETVSPVGDCTVERHRHDGLLGDCAKLRPKNGVPTQCHSTHRAMA